MPFRPRPAALLLALVATPAGAIMRRHDRTAADLGRLVPADHPVVVVGGLANGTLIGPQWVLTAAHVADAISPFVKTVTIGGAEVPFDSIRYHPGAFRDRETRVDMALLRLARPVTGVRPARLYDRDDEKGQVVLFVGTGNTGDGRGGVERGSAGPWRAARNRVSDVSPRVIRFVFDAPPAAESMEGISGPGDSGGPALITRDGIAWIAGVSSTNDQPGGQPICTYGTIETYARVSTQRAWIDSVTSGQRAVSPGSDWTPAADLGTWPPGDGAVAARSWFTVRNANDPARLEAFFQAHGDSAYLSRRTPEARRAAYAELWATFGAYTPVAWSARLDGTLAVLVRASKGGRWLDYRFVPSAREPGRLTRIESTDLDGSFTWPRR